MLRYFLLLSYLVCASCERNISQSRELEVLSEVLLTLRLSALSRGVDEGVVVGSKAAHRLNRRARSARMDKPLFKEFKADDFIMGRFVAQQGLTKYTQWNYYGQDGEAVRPNPLDTKNPLYTEERISDSIRWFLASLDDGTQIILKEYTGDLVSVGEREASIYEFLYGRLTLEAAMTGQAANRPYQVSPYLGCLRDVSSMTSAGFVMEWVKSFSNVAPPSPTGFWTVFRFETSRYLESFPKYEQQPNYGSVTPLQRSQFVKVVSKRCLEAVQWLHAQKVAHRSLSVGSFALSTFNQRADPRQILVAIGDMGSATTESSLSEEEISDAIRRGAQDIDGVIPFLCRSQDLYAMGFVLLEFILNSAAYGTTKTQQPSFFGSLFGGERPRRAAPAAVTDRAQLQRLAEEVYVGDIVGEFRSYCLTEPSWQAAVELLDESDLAGWQVVQRLFDCQLQRNKEPALTAEDLLKSPWFADVD